MSALLGNGGRWFFLFFLALALGLTGCTGPFDENGDNVDIGENGENGENGDNGDNGEETRSFTRIDPATGTLAGGTAVELTGVGFAEGLAVRFGAADCTGLVIVSETKVSCYTPAGAAEGTVDVTAVWSDDYQDVLGAAFTYAQEVVEGDPIYYCHLQWPPDLYAQPDQIEVGPVYAWVYHPGITDSDGQARALETELGYGAEGSDPRLDEGAEWTWFEGAFHDRKHNDLNELTNYEYQATLDAPATEGTYHYAYRIRIVPGGPWTYCHLVSGGGSNHEDGYSPAYAGVLRVARL